MSAITVFDPAMCCSSGVCGPKPDQKLALFSADLSHLKTLGHSVTRHNLAQEPALFTTNLTVKTMPEAKGNEALPMIFRDGEMISYGGYPNREALVAMAAGAPSVTVVADTEVTATPGCNCTTGSC